MSLASDEFDLLSLLSETNVQDSPTMCYITLTIFSWSLFQFSLNLLATRGRSFNNQSNYRDTDRHYRDLQYDEENYLYEDHHSNSCVDNDEKFIEKLNNYAMHSKNFLKNHSNWNNKNTKNVQDKIQDTMNTEVCV